jgi:hypothetical protein
MVPVVERRRHRERARARRRAVRHERRRARHHRRKTAPSPAVRPFPAIPAIRRWPPDERSLSPAPIAAAPARPTGRTLTLLLVLPLALLLAPLLVAPFVGRRR